MCNEESQRMAATLDFIADRLCYSSMATQDSLPTEDPKSIAMRLELTRRALNLKANEFAEGAGVTVNTYYQYEAGINRPSLDNALKLCRRYKLTLDWIYRDDMAGLEYHLGTAIKGLLDVPSPNGT
jgi:DNA-binding XRE family transcriptional regulator